MSERLAEDRLRALQTVTDAALSYLPLEQTLTELLVRITKLLDVDTAAVLLLEEDGRTLVVRAAKGLEEEVEREVRIPVGRGFAGRIAGGRKPVKIDDVDKADIYNPILRQKGLKSLLSVPLLLETRVIGVLHVGTLTPRAFVDEDVEVLQLAADRVALSIGGRLVERERGLADAFQRSFIPPLPTVPGITLAARYKPAAAAQLGGDWYDVFLLPTGAIGVAIGDVVGRGSTPPRSWGSCAAPCVRSHTTRDRRLGSWSALAGCSGSSPRGGARLCSTDCWSRMPGPAWSPGRATRRRCWSTPTARPPSSTYRPPCRSAPCATRSTRTQR